MRSDRPNIIGATTGVRMQACNGCEFIGTLHYDPEFQIWVRREQGGTLTVGMTDISQTVAGKILHVRVRRPGTRRPAGKPVATVESGKWAGPVPNFFDCVIVEGNPAVLADPALLNADPYGAWISRVEPTGGADLALADFLTGDAAFVGYCERVRNEDIQCERRTE